MPHGPHDLRLSIRDRSYLMRSFAGSCTPEPPLIVRRRSRQAPARRSPVSDSSLGVVQRSPLHRNRRRASTPRSPEGSPLARGCHTSKLVPSLSFLPTSTVYSAHHPAGLLHPASGRGVRCVSSPVRMRPEDHLLAIPFPAAHITPFRAFPSPSAAPRHRGRCPLVVPLSPSTAARERALVAGSDRPPQGLAPTSSP